MVDILLRQVRERPDDMAYAFLAESEREPEELSLFQVDRCARSIGALLQALDVEGERALLLFPPGLDFITTFLGCLYAGVIAVPAHPPQPGRTQPRLSSIALDARPRVVLTTSSLLAKAGDLKTRVPALRDAVWIAADEADPDLATTWRKLAIDSGQIAFLQYTSGSTSTPKGVMVSHANLLHNQESIRRAFAQNERSVIVGWLPTYHDMGLIGNVLQPLYLGARCILMSPTAFLQKAAATTIWRIAFLWWGGWCFPP